MNENLNLVEILKDCPRGTKLYSTIHGEVEIIRIINNGIDDYPISYKYKDKDGDCSIDNITLDGRIFAFTNGECTLFPSKDQRDWSKFNIEPKFDISTLQPFDKVLGRYNDNTKWTCDFYECYVDDLREFCCIVEVYEQCIPYNDETRHLVDTTEMPPKKYITWEE